MPSSKRVLVTGSTGYVGSRLVPRLLDKGYPVRVLARDVERLRSKSWYKDVDPCEGDACHPARLGESLSGIETAYYLIHSMAAGGQFTRRDVELAQGFAEAASSAGVRRIIYLGGLGEPGETLSEHLRSRHETGKGLRSSGVPVTEFRAAVIVGAGSISFEMIRNLTERIPLMICPRWVFTRTQPIAIDDVLSYLVAALDRSDDADRVIEIGGADVLTYGKMIKGYAQIRGLKRLLLPVPVLTPKLSSHWVHWTTPVPAVFARPLIEGLRSEVVIRDDQARALFPRIRLMGYDEAIRRALSDMQPGSFQEVLESILRQPAPAGISREVLIERGMIVEVWQKTVRAAPEAVYGAFSSLGGTHGWLHMDWAWRLRARVDRLLGGVGMRRGRPEDELLQAGDTLDFFRVQKVEPGRSLRLRVEMRLPGAGWLQFDARPMAEDLTRLGQVVFYAPRGLLGLLYWYMLYPIHRMIFAGLLRKLARLAERTVGDKASTFSLKDQDG